MSIVSLGSKKLALTIGISALSWLHAGVAQAADKALAESLFDAGRELMQAGNFDQACPKFAESQRQDPSPGTLINLAKCYEGLGRTASAWAEYKEAATLARTMGRDNQAVFADEGAKRLEGSLSKLSVNAPSKPIPNLIVTRDGVELGAGSLGLPLAVDPGEHVIEAHAPGYKAFSSRISLKPQGDQQVVQVPELEREGAPVLLAGPPVSQSVAPNASAQPGPSETAQPKPGGSNKILAYVFGGVGVVGLAVGSVFALSAKSQANSAQKDPTLCPNKVCTKAGRDEIDGAERKAMVANVGFGLGLVGIGVGVYFLVTENKQESTPALARVTPWVGNNSSGVSYTGAF